MDLLREFKKFPNWKLKFAILTFWFLVPISVGVFSYVVIFQGDRMAGLFWLIGGISISGFMLYKWVKVFSKGKESGGMDKEAESSEEEN